MNNMASEHKVVVEWTPSPRGMLGPLTLEQAWRRAYNAYWDAVDGTGYREDDADAWDRMIQEITVLGEEWRFLDRLFTEKNGNARLSRLVAQEIDDGLEIARYRRDQDLARNK
jgi:hypothetical protein